MFFLVFFNDYFVNYALLLKGAEVITPFHDTLVLMQLESQQRHSNVPFTNTDVAQKRRLYDRSLWCIATTLRASIQWRYCSRELEWHLPKTPKKKASLKTQKWISICFVGKNPIWRNLILHKTRCQSGKFLWDNITVKAFGHSKGEPPVSPCCPIAKFLFILWHLFQIINHGLDFETPVLVWWWWKGGTEDYGFQAAASHDVEALDHGALMWPLSDTA